MCKLYEIFTFPTKNNRLDIQNTKQTTTFVAIQENLFAYRNYPPKTTNVTVCGCVGVAVYKYKNLCVFIYRTKAVSSSYNISIFSISTVKKGNLYSPP